MEDLETTQPPSSPLPPGLDMMRPTYRGGTSGSSAGARGRTAVQSPVKLGMRPWTAEDVEYGFQLPDGDVVRPLKPQPIVEAGRSVPSENSPENQDDEFVNE